MPDEPFYKTDLSDKSLYQGDIVEDVPVAFPNHQTPWLLLRPKYPHTLRDALAGNTPAELLPRTEKTAKDPAPWELGEEIVSLKASRKAVIILTQSCDIANRKILQVAPLGSAADMTEDKLERLASGQVGHRFFLPVGAGAGHPRFADLTLMTSVHSSYFKPGKIVGRLSDESCFKLKRTLASFFGRPFGFDVSDDVVESRDYMCVPCFFNAARITRVALKAGVKFPACPAGCPKVQWLQAPPQI